LLRLYLIKSVFLSWINFTFLVFYPFIFSQYFSFLKPQFRHKCVLYASNGIIVFENRPVRSLEKAILFLYELSNPFIKIKTLWL